MSDGELPAYGAATVNMVTPGLKTSCNSQHINRRLPWITLSRSVRENSHGA
jgi:hypothetical protein